MYKYVNFYVPHLLQRVDLTVDQNIEMGLVWSIDQYNVSSKNTYTDYISYPDFLNLGWIYPCFNYGQILNTFIFAEVHAVNIKLMSIGDTYIFVPRI